MNSPKFKPVQTKAPPIKYRDWKNKRTGETIRVPEGIDPGFDTNPGKTRLKNISRFLAGKLDAADVDVAHTAIRDIVSSKDFAAFYDAPAKELSMPVLRMHNAAAEAIGAQEKTATLSGETLIKNKANHPELNLEDYRMLPQLGEAPELIVQDGANTVVLVRRSGRIYRGTVKATRSREGTFLTSFRLTHPNDVQHLLRKGKVIYGKWE